MLYVFVDAVAVVVVVVVVVVVSIVAAADVVDIECLYWCSGS